MYEFDRPGQEEVQEGEYGMIANAVEDPSGRAGRAGGARDHSVHSVGDQPADAKDETEARHPPVGPAQIGEGRADAEGKAGKRQGVGGNAQTQRGRQKQPPNEVDEPDIGRILGARIARAVGRRNPHARQRDSAHAAAATVRETTGSDSSCQSHRRRSRGLKNSKGSLAHRMLRWTQVSAIRSASVGILPPCLLSQPI